MPINQGQGEGLRGGGGKIKNGQENLDFFTFLGQKVMLLSWKNDEITFFVSHGL